MKNYAIEAEGITKVFGAGKLAFTALHEVSFSAHVGELVMLSGPSGSGKTTLLSILGCVLTPTAGSLSLLGHRVSARNEAELVEVRSHKIGFVFQGNNLLASLSARENIATVLELRGASRRFAVREAEELLARVGLAEQMDRRPNQLSGGQRQRVAIARALAGSPPIVLADEPTAALDAHNGLAVTELLRTLCQERGVTAVVVTHDARIFHLADRQVHIEDGRIRSAA